MQVNLSSIPFKSTYKFDYEANNGANSYNNQAKIDDFAFSRNLPYSLTYHNGCDCDCCASLATGTIIAPDYRDMEVEDFCKSNGIPFEKISYATLVGEDAIINRCVLPEQETDKKIVLLDVKKFDDIVECTDFGNIDYCREMYKEYFSQDAHNMILSGDDIEVPSLYINAPYGRTSASLMFNQTSEKPNQCLYFAMKSIGMPKVPVAVNEDSYQAGCELGLFE